MPKYGLIYKGLNGSTHQTIVYHKDDNELNDCLQIAGEKDMSLPIGIKRYKKG